VLLRCVISFISVRGAAKAILLPEKQNKSKRDDRGINGLCDLSYISDRRLDEGKPWFRLRMVRGGVFDGCLQVKSRHDDGDAVYKEQSGGGAACIIDASLFP
jgi:hypothetical protein